jgi:hypothetical protein
LVSAPPLKIRVTARDYGPPAEAWRDATPAERRRYWVAFGACAKAALQARIGKGLDVRGRQFLRLLGPRPDGTTTRPLRPHGEASRAVSLVRYSPDNSGEGLTLFWARGEEETPFGVVMGYHARGIPSHVGDRVREAGLTRTDLAECRRRALKGWERPKVPGALGSRTAARKRALVRNEALQGAARQGYTRAEYRKIRDELAEAAVRGAEVYTQIGLDRLESVLTAGKVKSRFETRATGTESKALNLVARREAEDTVLGVSPSVPNDRRPVYGFLAGPSFTRRNRNMLAYGGVTLRLKSTVKARSTVTFGDSIDRGRNGRLQASPLLSPRGDSFDPRIDLAEWQAVPKGRVLEKVNAEFDYAEAQVHGGVSVEDIAEVGFASPPPPALAARLKRLGIKYRTLR